jgi:SAM-dependent methyltransferase
MPPILKAFLAQAVGWLLALALWRHGFTGAGIWALVGTQALSAATLAALLHSDRWWLAIHLGFAPMLLLAGRLSISPHWYLAAFVLLALIYWTSFRTRVPLYLSGRAAVSALQALLPPATASRMLDLGSGLGSPLLPLARRRPDCHFTGIEAAPGPFLISRLRARGQPNLVFARGDFFTHSWAEFDIVYAYLSPVPMAAVWEKACREMHAGSLLVSNSFPIPGVVPLRVIALGSGSGNSLYVYRPGDAHRGRE